MAESHQTAKQVLIEVGDRAYNETYKTLLNERARRSLKEVREASMEAAIDAIFAEPELIEDVQGGW